MILVYLQMHVDSLLFVRLNPHARPHTLMHFEAWCHVFEQCVIPILKYCCSHLFGYVIFPWLRCSHRIVLPGSGEHTRRRISVILQTPVHVPIGWGFRCDCWLTREWLCDRLVEKCLTVRFIEDTACKTVYRFSINLTLKRRTACKTVIINRIS